MTKDPTALSRRLAAEAAGTAGLLIAVVGSGIMGEGLSGGNAALALLANSLATGFALAVLILVFMDISGAHFNPVVTLAEAFGGGVSRPDAFFYILAQSGGALVGVVLANLMFAMPAISVSGQTRTGPGLWLAEVIAAFGLVFVILQCAARRPNALPLAVGGYIAAAYWCTSSTSFANPAVTLGRVVTDTFTGIRPQDASAFVVAQIVGAAAATFADRWFKRYP